MVLHTARSVPQAPWRPALPARLLVLELTGGRGGSLPGAGAGAGDLKIGVPPQARLAVLSRAPGLEACSAAATHHAPNGSHTTTLLYRPPP
jgi:hypothetical protein